MKFIHTADWHYGYRQYGFPQREEDFYIVGQHIKKRALELQVNALVIAGDIFDSPKPPAYAVWHVCQIVRELREADILVYGIDGNHDAAKGYWLGVCGIQELGPKAHVVKGIKIAGVHATRPTLFKKALEQMSANNWHADVFVLHQALGEFADFEAQDLTALELSAPLGGLGVRYVAMGDIHDYKETVVGGVRFVYPGAPEINAIDEQHDKSISIVDITKDELKTALEPLPTRSVLETHLQEEKNLDNLLAEIDKANQPLAVVWYDPDVRELAKRAEAILRDKDIMYRICPLSRGKSTTLAAQLNRQGFERKGSLAQLKSAVGAFFDESSDQYQLVFQLLETPDSVTDVVKQYLQSKGVGT